VANRTIEQIVLFFQKNRDLIVIPIASILSAYLVTRFRGAQERKKQHLKEIKDKVLQPLKEGIERYYLPALEKKKVNIKIDTKSKPAKFVTEEDYKKANKRLEFTFIILEPKEAPLAYGTVEPLGKLPSFVPDLKFYSCVKKKHFPSFIRQWEEFKQKFDTYNKRSLEIAEKIKEEIKEKTNLPSFQGSHGGADPWISEYDVSLFILKKSLQKDYSDLLTTKEETNISTLYVGTKQVAQGGNLQIKKCVRVIKELIKSAQKEEQIKELVKQADVLVPEVKRLRDKVEILLRQKRLPGKCEYT